MSVSKRECLERIRDLDTERRKLQVVSGRILAENAQRIADLEAEIERLRAERDDYQRALEQYALHRNWSCCDLGENHAHGEQCCRDWWQGADDDDLDSGYVLAEEVLASHAAQAAGGNDE